MHRRLRGESLKGPPLTSRLKRLGKGKKVTNENSALQGGRPTKTPSKFLTHQREDEKAGLGKSREACHKRRGRGESGMIQRIGIRACYNARCALTPGGERIPERQARAKLNFGNEIPVRGEKLKKGEGAMKKRPAFRLVGGLKDEKRKYSMRYGDVGGAWENIG